jgi:hypothetical protein
MEGEINLGINNYISSHADSERKYCAKHMYCFGGYLSERCKKRKFTCIMPRIS